MSGVFQECLPEVRFTVLSGPSFAAEVCEGQPTLVVAASRQEATAREAQDIFSTSRFRVYSHDDVVGVVEPALRFTGAVAAPAR